MSDDTQIEMTPLDYGRSFLIGKGRTNEARFWTFRCVPNGSSIVWCWLSWLLMPLTLPIS